MTLPVTLRRIALDGSESDSKGLDPLLAVTTPGRKVRDLPRSEQLLELPHSNTLRS